MLYFLKNYKETIKKKYNILIENIDKINNYKEKDPLNKLIITHYINNINSIISKVKDLDEIILNFKKELIPETEENLKLEIKLITKNDIICIINYKLFM